MTIRLMNAPVLAIVLLAAVPARAAFAQEPDGETLFATQCASCHSGQGDSRAPDPDALGRLSPAAVLDALANGAMRVQGASLNGPERRALAEYLGGERLAGDATGTASGRCTSPSTFSPDSAPAWNGWGADVRNTRSQSTSGAGLTADDVPKLELRWAFGFPDTTSSWAQPTVAGGRVFVGSQNGTVYSLDAETGCIRWFFSADGGVRTAITVGPGSGDAAVAYFGDTSAQAYALDAGSGALLWKRRVEAHPLARITGAPTLYGDRLYVPMSSYEESQGARPEYPCCTFRGSVTALDTATGEVVWQSYMIPEEPAPRGESTAGVTLYGPAGVSVWSAPTIDADRGLIYVGTGNGYTGDSIPSSDAVVALGLATGRIVWTQQLFPDDVYVSGCRRGSEDPNCSDQSGPDYDFGNSPILATLPDGRDVIVIGQKSGVGWALDPDRGGAVLWEYRAGVGSALGGIQWGSAADEGHAYFAVADTFTPNPGGLHAVDLATGERVWLAPPEPPQCPDGQRCNAAQAAAVTVIPGVVFSGSNDGVIRAYSASDGSILWRADTNREYQTVNAVPARGASMLGPGATVAGGMLYVPSGYGAFGGRAGNVLLAFGVADTEER